MAFGKDLSIGVCFSNYSTFMQVEEGSRWRWRWRLGARAVLAARNDGPARLLRNPYGVDRIYKTANFNF